MNATETALLEWNRPFPIRACFHCAHGSHSTPFAALDPGNPHPIISICTHPENATNNGTPQSCERARALGAICGPEAHLMRFKP